MGNYKVIFKLDSAIDFKDTHNVNEIEVYKRSDKLYAAVNISATSIEEAEKLANGKITNICSSLSFVSGQVVIPTLDVIEDLSMDPPRYISSSEIIATLTVSENMTSSDMKDASNISRLIEQSHELELVLLLVNRPDFKTWVTLYKIYEIINKDVGIERQKWVTNKEKNSFRRTANHLKASNIHDSRHGVPEGEAPPNPLTIDEGVALIKRLIGDWIKFLNERSLL